MTNYKFLFLFFCTFVFSNEYINIELSDSKKSLSKEIFKKLKENLPFKWRENEKQNGKCCVLPFVW